MMMMMRTIRGKECLLIQLAQIKTSRNYFIYWKLTLKKKKKIFLEPQKSSFRKATLQWDKFGIPVAGFSCYWNIHLGFFLPNGDYWLSDNEACEKWKTKKKKPEKHVVWTQTTHLTLWPFELPFQLFWMHWKFWNRYLFLVGWESLTYSRVYSLIWI